MAFQMVHMEVAYRMLKYMPDMKYKEDFILGSVAPDSVHMETVYKVEDKIDSHLFWGCGPWAKTTDSEKWKNNILDFWEKSKEIKDVSREFLMGYAVHCLTDYCNDLNVWIALKNKSKIPEEELKKLFYPESRGIDQWLFLNSPNAKNIMELLEKGRAFSIENKVKKEMIEKEKLHLLNRQYKTDLTDEVRANLRDEIVNNYRFVPPEFMEKFLNQTAKDLYCMLK
ncbi:zinc dependent phospholipase C family protein [Lachnobacterium bovis]|uniref:Zinc dependent phospholipase C n=1 Tax=Lachnobacterium bovis TaxID=140626 RepID=A0A1H9R0I7_9FIRM|nr:zinc dependent phospholipase C family protein [Lachnobacterium bovis]SER66212.1 Zinc dependent phospholipase C [Lachnobacterium bovis]